AARFHSDYSSKVQIAMPAKRIKTCSFDFAPCGTSLRILPFAKLRAGSAGSHPTRENRARRGLRDSCWASPRSFSAAVSDSERSEGGVEGPAGRLKSESLRARHTSS